MRLTEEKLNFLEDKTGGGRSFFVSTFLLAVLDRGERFNFIVCACVFFFPKKINGKTLNGSKR